MTIASIIHNIANYFEKESTVAETSITHPTLTSTRLWVVAGLGAAVVWLAHGVLTEHTMLLLSITAWVYIIANSFTRWAQIKAETALKAASLASPILPAPKA